MEVVLGVDIITTSTISDGESVELTQIKGGLLYILDGATGGYGLYAVRTLGVDLLADKYNNDNTHYTVARGDNHTSVFITRVGTANKFTIKLLKV